MCNNFTFQSLSDQEIHLKAQVKELEVNVAAAAPDKKQQTQMEKTLEAFRKGMEVPIAVLGFSFCSTSWLKFISVKQFLYELICKCACI